MLEIADFAGFRVICHINTSNNSAPVITDVFSHYGTLSNVMEFKSFYATAIVENPMRNEMSSSCLFRANLLSCVLLIFQMSGLRPGFRMRGIFLVCLN